MKNPRIHTVFVFCAFLLIGLVASFVARVSRGQSATAKAAPAQIPTAASTLQRTVSLNASPAAREAASSLFTDAAAENTLLRNDLSWAFGGKSQRGWYLYDLLIGRTFNLASDASAAEFANSVAAWQKQKGLPVNGLVDEQSLKGLISQWQSERLKDKTPATPDQLLTAPVTDFYDSQRTAELRQVERRTYDAYKEMLAAAIADPSLHLAHSGPSELAPAEKYLKIVSAFRSREYQDHLRQQSPNAGSAGLAVNSPHFTGRALDLYVGGDPVDTSDRNRAVQVNTPVYQWLVRNAARFGFQPYFYEPWHWEYVK